MRHDDLTAVGGIANLLSQLISRPNKGSLLGDVVYAARGSATRGPVNAHAYSWATEKQHAIIICEAMNSRRRPQTRHAIGQ